MFNYKPLADIIKERNESIKDIASLLNVSSGELCKKLNNNQFLSMIQLHKLCEHFECGPESIMGWSPDGDLVKLDWNKVAAFGKPLTVLSIECGLSRSSLSNTRKGSGRVKAQNARKIAEVLECSVEDLM